MANCHYVHNLWQSVRGTPNIFMFWLFPENGSISERTVNRGINSSYNSIKFCINKKTILIFIFAMYQNYPLALNNGLNFMEHQVWENSSIHNTVF